MQTEMVFTSITIYEVAVVVFSTLIVMLLLRPHGPIEWATTGKETAFSLIMASTLYLSIFHQTTPQPYRSMIWAIVAFLLTNYLMLFFGQWASPFLPKVCQSCFRPKGAIAISLLIVCAFYLIALRISGEVR